MNRRYVKRAASAAVIAGVATASLALTAGTASAAPHNVYWAQHPTQAACEEARQSTQDFYKSGIRFGVPAGSVFYCAQNDKGWALWVREP